MLAGFEVGPLLPAASLPWKKVLGARVPCHMPKEGLSVGAVHCGSDSQPENRLET